MSDVFLLDVNVLVALAWPNHVHHQAAHTWFARHGASWATCAVTELGFVRVSSGPALGPQAQTVATATDLLARLTALPGHSYWADEARYATAPGPARGRVVSSRHVTDAYLIALCVHHAGRLATLDRGVTRLADAHHASIVEVLPT